MSSGWPHSQVGQGMLPSDQRHVPLGPDVSWPAGYSDLEYRDGDYRYGTPQASQLPAVTSHGEHPYAAFSADGYGDDGYRDPGYQGPRAQDAGIAGTRTVRGFVEAGQQQPGYAHPGGPSGGYAQPGYPSDQYGHGGSGYAGSGYAPAGEIEMAYPPAAAPGGEAYHGADSHRQPWDYDQPLRYDDEEVYLPAQDGYPATDYGHSGGYHVQGGGEVRHQPAAYDPAAYNGSDYSMPGISGPGYDLSGIIGTGDFSALGYDEPSYDRLSYDDPRYEGTPGYDASGDPGAAQGDRFNDTRFDVPRFDETRLDALWLAADDVRQEGSAGGYGNDGFTDSPVRSGYSDFDRGPSDRFDETRLDMSAVGALDLDRTRFDVPAFDETRLDNLRAIGPATDMRPAAAAVLAPPIARPQNWLEDTSLDHFADLDLTDEPVPAAFTRTAERTLDRPEDDDTGTRRAVGRRRGRSGDRRQWMALGAIAVVAAGAIGGVLMKFTFSGPSGPAHEIAAPNHVGQYTESPNLEKQTHVASLASSVAASSSGQASDVKYAVYDQGKGIGGPQQMFMFVGGKLASADPGTSIANFEQTYPHAQSVPAGPLGGEAACTATQLSGEGSVSMCVWFDNDTFGALVSPTMNTAKLATTLASVRPSLELYAK